MRYILGLFRLPGDVTDDGSEASYALAKPVLENLKAPVYYVVGNHDSPPPMLKVLLGVTASGSDLPDAISRAYRACGHIQFDGMHYRTDIGRKGLERYNI